MSKKDAIFQNYTATGQQLLSPQTGSKIPRNHRLFAGFFVHFLSKNGRLSRTVDFSPAKPRPPHPAAQPPQADEGGHEGGATEQREAQRRTRRENPRDGRDNRPPKRSRSAAPVRAKGTPPARGVQGGGRGRRERGKRGGSAPRTTSKRKGPRPNERSPTRRRDDGYSAGNSASRMSE